MKDQRWCTSVPVIDDGDGDRKIWHTSDHTVFANRLRGSISSRKTAFGRPSPSTATAVSECEDSRGFDGLEGAGATIDECDSGEEKARSDPVTA